MFQTAKLHGATWQQSNHGYPRCLEKEYVAKVAEITFEMRGIFDEF